jgi:hypothetical protein
MNFAAFYFINGMDFVTNFLLVVRLFVAPCLTEAVEVGEVEEEAEEEAEAVAVVGTGSSKDPQSQLLVCSCLHLFAISNPFCSLAVGEYRHESEDQLVCRLTLEDKIPKFNSPVYFENKSDMGKIDEIFGPINEPVCHLFIC